MEGRNGIGFELYPYFAALSKRRLAEELSDENREGLALDVKQGDARTLGKQLELNSVDFIVTSPPYWGILNKKADHKVRQTRIAEGLVPNYGDDQNDLANVEHYDDFIEELADLLSVCGQSLNERRYMALIVGDFRHGSRYYLFHADIARAMEHRGYTLQASNVLYQRHKRVFPYGYPYAYVPNVHHQNIVVLRKDAK